MDPVNSLSEKRFFLLGAFGLRQRDTLLRDHADKGEIGEQDESGAGKQQVPGSDVVHHHAGERAAKRGSDDGADSEQSIEPFCLAGGEDIRCYKPSLRYERDAEQADERVENVEHPGPL